jgi:hypothetical protein
MTRHMGRAPVSAPETGLFQPELPSRPGLWLQRCFWPDTPGWLGGEDAAGDRDAERCDEEEAGRGSAEQRAVVELVRRPRSRACRLIGPVGLLKQMTKTVLENALNEKMTEHVGDEGTTRPAPKRGNIRNGTRAN